jgi:uncharacterized membrane protein
VGNNRVSQLIQNKQGTIKYWVEITPSQIEIKIHSIEPNIINPDILEFSDTKYVVVIWDIIKLSELQKKPGFVDQTLWGRLMTTDESLVNISNENVYSPFDVAERFLVDIFGNSLLNKPAAFMNPTSAHYNGLYEIFVSDSSDDFTKCTVRLVINPGIEYEIEGPSSAAFVTENLSVQDLMSPITLSSNQTTISADGSIVVNVQTDTFIDEVYLEQVYGMLNKTRVKLTNGLGSFTLFATGLEAGETVRVKAGHRKFTGIANFTVPVV